jgi:hypothetical protein
MSFPTHEANTISMLEQESEKKSQSTLSKQTANAVQSTGVYVCVCDVFGKRENLHKKGFFFFCG